MAKKPMKKRNGLGRGLGALLEDSPAREGKETSFDSPSNVGSINEINIDFIETNPFQPRTHFDQTALEELSESIKVQGIIQPITVRKLSTDKYQLISGERRFQASKLAGLGKIPAYVRTADDQQMLEMALIENIQRENLNAIEIALSYQRLLTECELKQEQLGDRVGKNRTTVNNYLRLLKLPPDIQAALRDKRISMGHARALITIENVDLQLDIFKKIINEDLSVRKVEELVRQSLSGKTKNKETKEEPENGKEIVQLQSKLTSHFGTRVKVKSDGNKGEIKIPFVSVDDLNRILDILEV
ncbi:ParB/RepB/Spo0J family partition protein [Fulvivirga maritima]|uniref:ParB/RepB/Spo0J family partition protein n=1 Tax=Fulvivirga maritima TaxID=2904247 RepID=UPI001F41B9E5|nr:ParB/RepB/Spo0J family partition protein [Fulvivirga maritima]UII26450.1 ParB/RepB/Spo0J family partition protein [Fulvivirga maritima]